MGRHHFQIKFCALGDALGFEEPILLLILAQALFQLFLDAFHSGLYRRARGHIMRIGIDTDGLNIADAFTCERVKGGDAINLIAKEIKAPSGVIIVSRKEFNRITAHAECAALKRQIIALILKLYKLSH